MAHRAEGLDDVFEHSIIVRENCTANKFFGDGTGITNLPAETETDPIFNAASAAITASLALVDPHIADTTIHYVNPGFLTSDLWTASGANVYRSTGNVGIGTTAPGAKLHIAPASDGDVGILVGKAGVSGIINSPTNMYINVDSDNDVGSQLIAFGADRTGFTGGTEWMRIKDGNVGIGTTSPTYPLHVSGALYANSVSSALYYGLPAETDPTFQAASAAYNLTVSEFQTASGAYATHAASSAIHFTSDALWSSMAICYAASAALTTHTADSSDPHGVTLTQTNLNVASCAITADNTASGANFVRGILIGTEASGALTASDYVQGTIYLKYT